MSRLLCTSNTTKEINTKAVLWPLIYLFIFLQKSFTVREKLRYVKSITHLTFAWKSFNEDVYDTHCITNQRHANVFNEDIKCFCWTKDCIINIVYCACLCMDLIYCFCQLAISFVFFWFKNRNTKQMKRGYTIEVFTKMSETSCMLKILIHLFKEYIFLWPVSAKQPTTKCIYLLTNKNQFNALVY